MKHPDPDPSPAESLLPTLAEAIEHPGLTVTPELLGGTVQRAEAMAAELPHLGTDHGHGLTNIRLGEKLAAGGMGVVHIAKQLDLRREVAVKTVRPDRATPQARGGLLHEAWVMGALEHPNIVPVHMLGQDDAGAPVFVMKRISGVSWGAVLADPSHPVLAGVSDALAWHLRVLVQVSQAVHFAHSRGAVHRDIKPENVMVGEFGEIYLIDWGIAVSIDDRLGPHILRADDVKGLAGTPAYMAPEMVDPTFAPLTPRTDVFLLGATLYEIVTGEPPNHGEGHMAVLLTGLRCDPPTLDASTPGELASIIRRALSRDPEQRYPDARTFARAIESFLEHRNSLALCTRASVILTQLEGKLSDATLPPEHAHEVQKLAATARFGFEQALALWADNDTAKSGLQTLLGHLARLALDAGDLAEARRILADMAQPSAELLARLESAEQAQASITERLAKLERYEREQSMSVGARRRAILFFVLGLVFATPTVMMGVFDVLGTYTPTSGGAAAVSFGYIAVLAAVLALGHRKLLANQANKRLFQLLALGLVVMVAHRVGGYAVGMAVKHVFSGDLLIFTTVGAAATIAVERRLLVVPVVFGLAYALAVAMPERIQLIMGLSELGIFTLIAWDWSRTARAARRAVGPPGHAPSA